jgi:hypothetical protein
VKYDPIKQKHNFEFVQKFESQTEAEKFINSEEVWRREVDFRNSKQDEKQFYNCFFKSSGCNASLCLIYNAHNLNIMLQRDNIPHEHHEKKSQNRGIPDEIKNDIAILY